jgi:hypothetical protein
MNDWGAVNRDLAASLRQRWRFSRLVAVAQSAYDDAQGELAMCALEGAWLAADDEAQFEALIVRAQFMLDHPIEGLDEDLLHRLVSLPLRMELTLSA